MAGRLGIEPGGDDPAAPERSLDQESDIDTAVVLAVNGDDPVSGAVRQPVARCRSSTRPSPRALAPEIDRM